MTIAFSSVHRSPAAPKEGGKRHDGPRRQLTLADLKRAKQYHKDIGEESFTTASVCLSGILT